MDWLSSGSEMVNHQKNYSKKGVNRSPCINDKGQDILSIAVGPSPGTPFGIIFNQEEIKKDKYCSNDIRNEKVNLSAFFFR